MVKKSQGCLTVSDCVGLSECGGCTVQVGPPIQYRVVSEVEEQADCLQQWWWRNAPMREESL